MLDQINELPVKKANGAVVYARDVAVLMTILKAGSTSTLDIIDGVKSLLPRIEQSLPPNRSAHRERSVYLHQKRGPWGSSAKRRSQPY